MSTIWKEAAPPRRELNIDEAAATEDVLAAAAEWDAGTLPLSDALLVGGGMNPHRARGLAFMHRREDPRLPALQRLSEEMSGASSKILPDGSMVPWHLWNANEWHIEQAKRNGAL